MERDQHRHKAFTIVELMVVISVIALLVALLMPALKGAKEKAKAVACAGNLKQVGVAIYLFCDDHENDFMGLSTSGWGAGGGATWFAQLGRAGYLGGQVRFTKQHVDNRYGPTVNYRWEVLKCPSEPMWTSMNPSSFYSGVPYNNYLNEYVASSYDMNFQAYNIQPCWLCNCGVGNPSDCTARRFLTPTWPGTTTGNALIIMDNATSNFDPVMPGNGYYDYNCIGWHTPCFWGPTFGMNYGTGNIVSILNEPGHMHAFRHPGKTANGLFLDGHVAPVKPYELTARSEWPHLNIWKKNGPVSEWYSTYFP